MAKVIDIRPLLRKRNDAEYIKSKPLFRQNEPVNQLNLFGYTADGRAIRPHTDSRLTNNIAVDRRPGAWVGPRCH